MFYLTFSFFTQAAKLLANLIVMGSGVLGRAVLHAYRKALESKFSAIYYHFFLIVSSSLISLSVLSFLLQFLCGMYTWIKNCLCIFLSFIYLFL